MELPGLRILAYLQCTISTFSTFSNDGLLMLRQGQYGMFFLYVLLSITLGIAAALAGGAVGR